MDGGREGVRKGGDGGWERRKEIGNEGGKEGG